MRCAMNQIQSKQKNHDQSETRRNYHQSTQVLQRHLTEQISFHNAIEQTNAIRKSLIDELYKTEDVLDPLVAASKNQVARRRKK